MTPAAPGWRAGPRTALRALGAAGVFAWLVFAPPIPAQSIFAIPATFTGKNGADPRAGLAIGADKNLYGTTFLGGDNNLGTVFRMTPAGGLTVLYSFSGADGSMPEAGLMQGTDGNFYGTTAFGGNPNGAGTVFRITPSGTLTTLYRFADLGDGRGPQGGLLQGKDGNFYGTTSGGGTYGAGTVYRITPSGALTTLYNFTGSSDGYGPSGTLAAGADGSFYGTTSGLLTPPMPATAFRITPGGTLTTLYSFAAGEQPEGGLVAGADGDLYGTTMFGGVNKYGSVFQLTPAGVRTTLHSFSLSDGAFPRAGLLQGSGENFYGTTSGADNSGRSLCPGTVFRLTPQGAFTTLHYFDPAEDFGPSASLVQDSAGNLYGTTESAYLAQGGVFEIPAAPNSLGAPAIIWAVAGGGATFSDNSGPATWTEMSPAGTAVDAAGNLYIADASNNRVRRVSPAGIITTVAGSGAVDLPFVDSNGNRNCYDLGSFSGDGGPATAATLDNPSGVAVDAVGNLYIADSHNNRIRKVSPDGIITTVAGSGVSGAICGPYGYSLTGGFSGDGGPATAAMLSNPTGIALDAAGDLFIADAARIRKVSTSGIITTVAGNGGYSFTGDGGPAISASVTPGGGIALDAAGDLFIPDQINNRVRKVSPDGVITTVAGNGTAAFSGDGGPAVSASLYQPAGVAVDAAGNLFIADLNNRVREVSAGGIINTVAGNGVACIFTRLADGWLPTQAQICAARVTLDASGNLFVTANSLVLEASPMAASVPAIQFSPAALSFSVSPGGTATRQIAVSSLAGIPFTNATAWTASASANWITVSPATGIAPASISVAVNAASLAAGAYTAAITISNPKSAPSSETVNVSVTVSTGPTIASIAPIDSTVETIQPGEWVSIYGMNLAATTANWNGDFPASLGGTSVTINGKAAYLSYVSPTQINLQAPDDSATGAVPVVVKTALGTASATVTLARFGPAFLLFDNKHAAGIILRTDGSGAYGGGTYDLLGPAGNSLGYPTVAAKAGDTIALFAVGLGPTNPTEAAGQPFSGAAPAINPVGILIGNVNVMPAFAGLSGPGLFQINLTVPPGLGTGDLPLTAIVAGIGTPQGVVISLQ